MKKTHITPEEVQDIKDWLPSQEQADDLFKICPITEQPGCCMCYGSWCEFHRSKSCNCSTLERHGLGEGDLENDIF